MRKKENASIANLKAEIARMEEAIKAKTKALREEERRVETRKKVLLGVVLQKWVEEGKISEEELRAGLDTYLKRKDERALFALEPLPEENSAKAQPSTKKPKEPKPTPPPEPTPLEEAVTTQKPQSQRTAPKPLKEVNQKNMEDEFET